MNLKIFLSILAPLFITAMGTGIYLAYSSEEGLVDDNYFEKASSYFHSRGTEQELGLVINPPRVLKRGSNDISVFIKSHGKPFEHADVTLFIGDISTMAYDRSLKMKELSPGNYHAGTAIPFRGKWLVRVEVSTKNLSTNRKWFYDVN
ncbi:MAG: hypothetical protein HGA70_08160 [Chlorobiaceae bacterium]|nr:hypothetical protein [Chlorobiaceae bacterium]NTW10519.1 hypothetical protein [Chlorobiaceae bacterium]